MTIPLRVLHVTSQFHDGDQRPLAVDAAALRSGDAVGGMQMQVYKLTESLAARGLRQRVITRKLPWTGRRSHGGSVEVFRAWPETVGQLLSGESVRLARVIAALLPDTDVVHVHGGEEFLSIPIGIVLRMTRPVPVVLTIHSSWHFTYHPSSLSGHVRRLIGRSFEWLGMHMASVVCTLTDAQRGRVADLGGRRLTRVVTVPAGVDRSLFDVSADGEAPWARLGLRIQPSGRPHTFVGRLVPQKGLHWLLRVFAGLARQGWNGVLLVCGDGPQRHELEAAARSFGLEDKVCFLGFVSWEQLPAILRHSAALVVPSIYEEFGAVVLEAMAARCPVIAARTGGLAETVRHGVNGLLADVGNDEQLTESILLVETACEFRAKLIDQAYTDVAKFDFARIADRYIRVYRSVCKH